MLLLPISILPFHWLDWDQIGQGQRSHIGDYYRPKDKEKKRGTCLLTPK